jgi:AraC family transcriptional regulator of adaptative response / DNA-3-methyladenine glycosylase II
MLQQTAIPGVEGIGDNDYRRTISLNGNCGHIHVAPDDKQPALRARICFGDPRGLFQIVERVRRIFDLNADWAAIVQTLGNDPLLAPRLRAAPGLRVPGCWDGFELTVRTLVTGNANSKGAADLARLVQAYGKALPAGHGLTHIFPEARTLAAADLSACGIAENRARAIRALAGAVAGARISFDNVVDSAALLAQLRDVASLSESTAEYIAMRALREPDAFPADRRMLQREFESVASLKRHAECWRPWRAYAAIYLTAGLDRRMAVPKLKRAAGTRSASNTRLVACADRGYRTISVRNITRPVIRPR